MAVFYEVATLTNPLDGQPFALIRIDTDKRVSGDIGDGVEGIVVSLHANRCEAESAANLATCDAKGIA